MAWRLSDFTEIGRLGAGATGRVVSARHDDTGTVVAIKYLSDQLRETPGFIERFRGEARLLVDINSPHIARLYEYVETEAGAAIVMELVDGVSLFEMIRQCGATEPEAALYILRGSLLGLAAAHQAGVVHRDYKPENVLIDGTGTSKLVDFGIAARAGQQAPAPGTPLYMSPEQWLGAAAGPRTDVYAATATFFECLTARPPFEATGGLVGLRRAHETMRIPLDAVPPQVRELVARGMSKDPRERPADAAAFLADLERVAAAGYGPDWAEIGKAKLVRVVAPLLLLLGAGAAGKGTANAVTKFLGSPLSTRILSGMALTVALVAGVGLAISGATNAAQVTAEPSPSFNASFPGGGGPTLAPTPGTGKSTATATPTGAPTSTKLGPTGDPTIGHTVPPPRRTTPGSTPTTKKSTTPPTTQPPTTTAPPPPTVTTITSVNLQISTSQDQMTWTLTVTTADTLPGTITLAFLEDTKNPPGNQTDSQSEDLGGQTSYTFSGTVNFQDDGCQTGSAIYYGAVATSPQWASGPTSQSAQENCPPPPPPTTG